MIKNEVVNEYFEWLYDLVCHRRFSREICYRKLLMRLHSTDFRWIIEKDENRARDGIALRNRFAQSIGYDDFDDYLDGPCSILEMMVALAIRCEETIMDDPRVGDRTGQWFWGMIVNLGLGSMSDDRIDYKYVDRQIECFLERNYQPNGRGGLFRIKNCTCDLRKVEIWIQLLWYLDTII